MVVIRTDALIQSSITEILREPTLSHLTFVFRVTSAEDRNYVWTPLLIQSISIGQDFEKMYTDVIGVKVRAVISTLPELYDHLNDLEATLRIIRLDNTGIATALNRPIDLRSYKCILVDPENHRKKFPGSEDFKDTTVEIEFQLIEKPVYKSRHESFHGVFKGTTVENLIRYVATDVLGYETVNMVPSENTHTYEQMIVPPDVTFRKFWTWIQERFGVYSSGLSSYVTGNRLYIWPPYLHKPDSREIVNLYLDNEGGHEGLRSYHRTRGMITDIVLDGNANQVDLTQNASENTGTGFMLSRSGTTLDGDMQTTNDGSFYTQEGGARVTLEKNAIGMKNSQNLRFVAEPTDNVLKLMSAIKSGRAEIVSAIWKQANLDILKPGHRLNFTYMDGNRIAFSPGVLGQVRYDMVRIGEIGSGLSSFGTTASLTWRSDPSTFED